MAYPNTRPRRRSVFTRIATAAVFRFACVVFVLLSPPAARVHAEYNPMMRIDSRVDDFTRRAHARYGLLPKGAYRQPMGSADFLSYLDTLSGLPLTGQERCALDGLRGHLSLDRGIYGLGGGESGYGFIVNLDLTGAGWARTGGGLDARTGGRGIISPQLRGYLGGVSFYSALDVWTEYVGDSLFAPSTYQPYDGVPYELYGRDDKRNGGSVRSSDLPRCGVGYDAGRIHLEAAIDYLRLGPAARYPLTLSGNAPPVTYARAVFDLGAVEYYHVVGALRSQKDKPKYIYANGLGGSLFDGLLDWGINEVMIGGSATNQQDGDSANLRRPEYAGQEQGWELAFFVPFVPMVFVEHYAGDKNNSALAFDACLNWPKNFRLYGEFFLDDMLAPWHILSDDWGNKWALTLGAQYFSTLYGRDISAGVEWSRVEPWVYTHFYGGSHRYDHFNAPLGSEMGPNSMAVVANCDIGVTKKVTLGLKLTSLSSNPSARGGKITDIFQDPGRAENPDSETKKFLGPGTIHYLRPGVYGGYDPFGLFRLSAGVEVDAARDGGRVHFALDGGFRF